MKASASSAPPSRERPRAETLTSVECTLMVEDAIARLRHDVFNCLAAVRSASYYIQRRVSGSEIWQSDPRIEKFFQLISEQLDTAVQRIERDPKADLPHRRSMRVQDGAEGVRRAIDQMAAQLPAGGLEAQIASGPLRADVDEFITAVAGTLSYLGSSGAGTRISLRAGSVEQDYTVRAEAKGSLPTLAGALLPRPLALARRVAVASGGRFQVDQEPGSLRIELSIPGGSPSELKLLIVDDDHAGRATLLALLELEGFAVHECASLAEARSRIALGDDYAVVLLDRRLPDGLGDSLVPELREALPLAKIVLMTGEATSAVPPGFDAAHQKGLDPTALLALVASVLGPAQDQT